MGAEGGLLEESWHEFVILHQVNIFLFEGTFPTSKAEGLPDFQITTTVITIVVVRHRVWGSTEGAAGLPNTIKALRIIRADPPTHQTDRPRSTKRHCILRQKSGGVTDRPCLANQSPAEDVTLTYELKRQTVRCCLPHAVYYCMGIKYWWSPRLRPHDF